jgi:hypothetical protein
LICPVLFVRSIVRARPFVRALPGPRLLPSCRALVGVVLLTGASVHAAGVAGVILDAESSTQQFRASRGAPMQGNDWQVPIPDASFVLHAFPSGRNWPLVSDANGKFEAPEAPLGGGTSGERYAVTLIRGNEKLYSASFSGSANSEVFLYRSSEDPSESQIEVRCVFDLLESATGSFLRVDIVVDFVQFGSGMFVGQRSSSGHREVFRVPVPEGANVTSNEGPLAELRWKASDDGRWYIIDEPVPGFPDMASGIKNNRPWRWTLSYLVPALQLSATTIHIPVRCTFLALYTKKDAIRLVSTAQLRSPVTIEKNPLTGEDAKFDAFGMAAQEISPGTRLVIALEVDNGRLGEVSYRALRWYGAFLVVTLVAILLGLVLGRRRRDPVAPAGLSHDELLDRIVELDQRFQSGKIADAEYRPLRESLVELVAVGLDESARPAAPAIANALGNRSSAPSAPSVDPRRAELLRRIRELDGSTEPARITERAHLLEALYKYAAEEIRE